MAERERCINQDTRRQRKRKRRTEKVKKTAGGFKYSSIRVMMDTEGKKKVRFLFCWCIPVIVGHIFQTVYVTFMQKRKTGSAATLPAAAHKSSAETDH